MTPPHGTFRNPNFTLIHQNPLFHFWCFKQSKWRVFLLRCKIRIGLILSLASNRFVWSNCPIDICDSHSQFTWFCKRIENESSVYLFPLVSCLTVCPPLSLFELFIAFRWGKEFPFLTIFVYNALGNLVKTVRLQEFDANITASSFLLSLWS